MFCYLSCKECELNPGGLTLRVSHSHISLSAKKGQEYKKYRRILFYMMIEAQSVWMKRIALQGTDLDLIKKLNSLVVLVLYLNKSSPLRPYILCPYILNTSYGQLYLLTESDLDLLTRSSLCCYLKEYQVPGWSVKEA